MHEQHLASSGLNARELAVLLLLADREPESQQQAAQRLGVDRTTMVGLLDGLESMPTSARTMPPAYAELLGESLPGRPLTVCARLAR